MEEPQIEKSELGDEHRIVLFPATVKQAYQKAFYLPASKQWKIEGSLTDAYYRASKALIEGAISGPYMEGVEGIAGVFLFRHYLELGLKYALFHARWFKSWNENERDKNVEGIKKSHFIDKLWNDLKDACKTRIPPEQWKVWDIEFVDKCIDEFHAVDPKSFHFRFGTREKIAVASNSEPYPDPIGIDFESLLHDMIHVHDILEAIDSYLFESYGKNEEWQSILNSF